MTEQGDRDLTLKARNSEPVEKVNAGDKVAGMGGSNRDSAQLLASPRRSSET
jgi:hypothetical protein